MTSELLAHVPDPRKSRGRRYELAFVLAVAVACALAGASRLDGLLTAIAIDGKWLRGVLDGQVKLLSAMLHDQKVVIGGR